MSHGPRSACPALYVVRKVQDTVQSKAGHEAQCHHKGPTLGLVHLPMNRLNQLKEILRALQDAFFCCLGDARVSDNGSCPPQSGSCFAGMKLG